MSAFLVARSVHITVARCFNFPSRATLLSILSNPMVAALGVSALQSTLTIDVPPIRHTGYLF